MLQAGGAACGAQHAEPAVGSQLAQRPRVRCRKAAPGAARRAGLWQDYVLGTRACCTGLWHQAKAIARQIMPMPRMATFCRYLPAKESRWSYH